MKRSQPVKVGEPTIEDTVAVLKGVRKYYESYHRVKVSDETVRQAVVLSERYITDRFLPDKAIDLLDEACSCASLENQEPVSYTHLPLSFPAARSAGWPSPGCWPWTPRC